MPIGEQPASEPSIAADEPKTDREWLTRIDGKVDAIFKKLDGKGGICETISRHEQEINKNKVLQQRIYYLLIILIIAVVGRYIVGPTSWPFL